MEDDIVNILLKKYELLVNEYTAVSIEHARLSEKLNTREGYINIETLKKDIITAEQRKIMLRNQKNNAYRAYLIEKRKREKEKLGGKSL